MNILSWIGLVKKSEYDALNKLNDNCLNEIIKLKEENTNLKEKLISAPFEFNKLLNTYNEGQLNALYYKLINHCRNNKKFTEMLKRWDARKSDAIKTLKENKL